MSHKIKILSAYNGRLHESIIHRAEKLIGIEVDDNVVYFDEGEGKDFGVTIEDEDRKALENGTRIWRLRLLRR